MQDLLELGNVDHTFRDPHVSDQVVIRREYSGRVSKFRSFDKKLEMMSLIADVRGPLLYRGKRGISQIIGR